MAKLTDTDFGKGALVCTDCDHVFLMGLKDTKGICPKCGGKLQYKVLTREDTYLEKGD